MADPLVIDRNAPPEAVERLLSAGHHPLLARIYAARGVTQAEELSFDFSRLHAPYTMMNLKRMAALLADAIHARARLVIVADYDADGATACAVGLRALRAFGAVVDYLVPNRFEHGYGLTPEIVRIAHDRLQPDVLITVDNGIASVDGVAEANRLGMKVLITDHHLPGDALPDAWCIVNPNQRGCDFPSKSLAGVGVMFYLMLALRAELRERRTLEREPKLADLLDIVALGTVADVVRLDGNNRVLVQQGLNRIRAGRMHPGVAALFRVAGRDPARAGCYDLAFCLAPRVNAAGRMQDMSLGIECLATDDAARAQAIAIDLDRINRTRREVEAEMQESALASLEADGGDAYAIVLFHADWHQGVIGIVASRLKDRFHRPVIAFARGADGEIKGSGRSIVGLHLRDALDLVSKRFPGLILRFGGHAAAAGLTLRESDLDVFRSAFEETAHALLTPADLERQLETDGSLAAEHATFQIASTIASGVWGHGFPEPSFHDGFDVLDQRVIGEAHLKLKLARGERRFEAVLFGQTQIVPSRIDAVYRFELNDYAGLQSLQLTLQHWRPL